MTRLDGVLLRLAAGCTAFVSASALAQVQSNTCVAAVDGPHQGVHSQFDGSADAVAWPPNHKMHTVRISAVNEDGDECNVTITDVRQDEALNGLGDGNTSPDAANCDNGGNESTVDVRGERSGVGTGRYYHVMYTMDDPDAPMSPAAGDARVLVPHDQGIKKVWVDEGPLFASYEGAALACSQ
ncbi:MAG: hypothetical protein WC809_11590 [Sinimarinibacterium sp.]|jgi:hypothetical protein